MKLIELSSDIKSFRTIQFVPGFNVILGDSRERKNARAHNLGKTTAIKIIEYVLFN